MTDEHPDPRMVHSSNTLGPRWNEFIELNNTGARLIDTGDLSRARATLEAAYRSTLVDDVDAAGLDARARALANLAGLAEIQGRVDEALDFAARSLRWCDAVIESVGNHYGTLDVQTSVLINRAQTLQVPGRVDEAMADIDAVLERFDEGTGDNDIVLTFSLRNTKATALIAARRWQEAEAEARLTLEWAWEHAPDLVGHPYGNLAAIKQATGDLDAAAEFLSLASESHAANGSRSEHAVATAHRGRIALMGGDPATALRLYAEAERELTAVEDWRRLAETRYSRAVAALNLGEIDQARRLLAQVETLLAPSGNSVALAECRALVADIAGATGNFDAAESGFADAQRIYQEMGSGVDLAKLDVRWGVARYAHALADPGPEQKRILRDAASLAVPGALAVDALRHRFSPGPDRERWVSMVAAPATAMAFAVAAALNELPLVIDLMESSAATVSLSAEPLPPMDVDPSRVVVGQTMHAIQTDGAALGLAPIDESNAVPFAAAAIPGVDEPGPGFERPRLGLPPRLRTDPERDSVLDAWIDVAQQRYGLPIRSAEVIRSW